MQRLTMENSFFTKLQELRRDPDRLAREMNTMALGNILLPAGLFTRDYKILWINNTMALLHRCKPRDVVGRDCHEAFNNCHCRCDECCLPKVVETGRMAIVESWIDMPNGDRRWGELHAYPLRDEDHNMDTILTIGFDTTKHVLKNNEPDAPASAESPLSPRETEVLRHIAEGYTNAQISEALDISAHTVKTYVNSVFNKLGVNDRTLAAVQAIRQNLI